MSIGGIGWGEVIFCSGSFGELVFVSWSIVACTAGEKCMSPNLMLLRDYRYWASAHLRFCSISYPNPLPPAWPSFLPREVDSPSEQITTRKFSHKYNDSASNDRYETENRATKT